MGAGLFAALLLVLSIMAYRKLRSRRILLVSIAFSLFAVRAIVFRLDLLIPEMESSILELLLAVMSFAALSLFFVAIIGGKKVVSKVSQQMN
jgi:hypothetical protein